MSVVKQVGNITNVDRLDKLDRQKLDPRIKLELLMLEAKATIGVDPRSGRDLHIVARPRTILQMLLDLEKLKALDDIELERPTLYGMDADRVGRWKGVLIVVRSSVKDDNIYVVAADKIPSSSNVDRRRASELRMHAHAGSLQRLRDANAPVIIQPVGGGIIKP